MVENPLSLEVELTGLFWIELEANNSEALSMDQADRWVCFEGSCWVLQDLVVDWGIAGVRDLNRLVN